MTIPAVRNGPAARVQCPGGSNPAAVLARQYSPAGRWQRALPRARRGRSRRGRPHGRLPDLPLAGRDPLRDHLHRRAVQPGRRALHRLSPRTAGDPVRPARPRAARGPATARRRRRHPERRPLLRPPDHHRPRRGAGPPHPPRAVAGRRVAGRADRVVGRVVGLAARPRPVPVRHRVAAVGRRARRARRRSRAHRGRPQRPRPAAGRCRTGEGGTGQSSAGRSGIGRSGAGPAGHPRHRPAAGRPVPAGAAQTRRGRAGRARDPAGESTRARAGRHRQRLVGRPAPRIRRRARAHRPRRRDRRRW